jgi:hypothetical protein
VNIDPYEPPALGVNVNVACTAAFPATRSAAATVNVTADTEPPIAPEDTAGLDAVGSVLVCTVTESVAALAAPIVQPTRVTVTAASAARIVPVTAKMMDVLPGGPGARLVPAVDTIAVGVGVVAKKPDG